MSESIAGKLLATMQEGNDKKAMLDVSDLDRRELAKLVDELTAEGLKLGTDFFIKSGGDSWIMYSKYDRKPLEILMKYRVGEVEESMTDYVVIEDSTNKIVEKDLNKDEAKRMAKEMSDSSGKKYSAMSKSDLDQRKPAK